MCFYEDEMSKGPNDEERPKFPLSFILFKSDLKDVFLMFPLMYGLEHDDNVDEYQMGLAFKLKKEKGKCLYDFFATIVERMLDQLSKYHHYAKFRYSSLVHLILHHNPNFFIHFGLPLNRFSGLGLLKPISVWTHVLSSTYNYYLFT